MNPFEEAARLRKATMIADYLESVWKRIPSLKPPDPAEALEYATAEYRVEVAKLAGVRTPSDLTWSAVVEMIKRRNAVGVF